MDKYNKWLSNGSGLFYYIYNAKDRDGSGVAAEIIIQNASVISYIIRGNYSLAYFMTDNLSIVDEKETLEILNRYLVQRDAIKWAFLTNADHESYIIKDFS